MLGILVYDSTYKVTKHIYEKNSENFCGFVAIIIRFFWRHRKRCKIGSSIPRSHQHDRNGLFHKIANTREIWRCAKTNRRQEKRKPGKQTGAPNGKRKKDC